MYDKYSDVGYPMMSLISLGICTIIARSGDHQLFKQPPDQFPYFCIFFCYLLNCLCIIPFFLFSLIKIHFSFNKVSEIVLCYILRINLYPTKSLFLAVVFFRDHV
jgi:hypothetical protein